MSAESGAHVMLLTASESDERIFAARIPAHWKLTLKPTRDEALIHLLASPV